MWLTGWAIETSVRRTLRIHSKDPEDKLNFSFSIQMFSCWVAKKSEQLNSWALHKPLPIPNFHKCFIPKLCPDKRKASANTEHTSPGTRGMSGNKDSGFAR